MKPPIPGPSPQEDLFRPRLENLISPGHPPARLAERLGLQALNERLGDYCEDAEMGQPPKGTRLMAGLVYLKRKAIRYLTDTHGLSVQRACDIIGLSRSAWYKPLVDWLERDRQLAEALSALADQKPGVGFWKLFRRLRRQGRRWNHKRVWRVYCLLKLNRRRRAKERIPTRGPMPLMVPSQPNQVWSADFMSDALYHGMRFRTFNVLDDCTREALAIEIDTSLPSTRLVRVFEQLKAERGLPDVLRTDNGPRARATATPIAPSS